MAVNDPASDAGADPNLRDTFDRAYVESLRRENAAARVRLKTLSNAEATLSEHAATINDLRLQVALTEEAMALGIKTTAAKFYLSEAGQLADLDPTAEDFRETLKDRLESLRAENPELRQQPITRRSTTDGSTGGPGAGPSTQLTRSQLPGMKPEAVERALQDGRLNEILGRRP